MLSTLDGRVTNPEESMGDVKKTLEVVDRRIDELDLMMEQVREFMVVC